LGGFVNCEGLKIRYSTIPILDNKKYPTPALEETGTVE
jgi:hypothetical protein